MSRLAAILLVVTLAQPVIRSAGPSDEEALDLLQLYARATESDTVLQTAYHQWELGRQVLKEARSAVRPQLSASADASFVDQNIKKSENVLFTEGSSDFFNSTYSINLTQPLYRYEVLGRLPQARAEAERAAIDLAAEEQDLIFRLAEAVFNFLAARDGLEFATAEKNAIFQQLQESEQRLAAGLGVIGEVHDNRARHALAVATEIANRDLMEESRAAIGEITGSPPASVKSLSESFPLVGPDRPEGDAWVEAALFQNPRVKSLEAQAEAAKHAMRLQRGAGRYPALDLVGSYGLADSGGSEFGGGSEIVSRTVGLRLSVPLYDGGLASARTNSASLQYRIAQQSVERARRVVEGETLKAFRGVTSGIARVEALRQTVFSQEASLAAKQEGMRAGLATAVEVLDARKDLFLAKRDLAQARYAYILSSLSLKRWAGILTLADLKQINGYMQ